MHSRTLNCGGCFTRGDMKFCYVDESGFGGELVVVAGVIVDAARMHRTKAAWDDLLQQLDEESEGRVSEIKGRELYRGNAYWRELDSGERTSLIEAIISWMVARRHDVTFGAVSSAACKLTRDQSGLDGFEQASDWTIAAMHLLLSVQKHHQKQKNNKGKTVFVFDNARPHQELTSLVLQPPTVTGQFYQKQRRQDPLDQVIDVPYFADSQHAVLIQAADIFAFLLRLYAELHEGITTEKFPGELERLSKWIGQMGPVLLPDSVRWSMASKDPCTEFFRSIAPQSLLRIKT